MFFFEMLRKDYNHLRKLAGSAPAGVWRAFLNPHMYPVILIRLASSIDRQGLRPVAKLVSYFNVLLFKVEVPSRAVIGPGLVLPHPMGVVIGAARLGDNVVIFQNVTLGARTFDGAYDLALRPIIEDGVLVGSGAVVLGPITVGSGARVAANSLLLKDLPPGLTAIGVPAEIQRSRTQDGVAPSLDNINPD